MSVSSSPPFDVEIPPSSIVLRAVVVYVDVSIPPYNNNSRSSSSSVCVTRFKKCPMKFELVLLFFFFCVRLCSSLPLFQNFDFSFCSTAPRTSVDRSIHRWIHLLNFIWKFESYTLTDFKIFPEQWRRLAEWRQIKVYKLLSRGYAIRLMLTGLWVRIPAPNAHCLC